MDLKRIKTDPALEAGTWVEIDPTCSVKLRYTNSTPYRQALRKRLRPFSTLLDKTRGNFDVISESDQEHIAIEMLVDHVVLDWKGVCVGEEAISYSKENALKMLTDYPEFREIIERQAANLTNFREQQREIDTKNSGTVSAGS